MFFITFDDAWIIFSTILFIVVAQKSVVFVIDAVRHNWKTKPFRISLLVVTIVLIPEIIRYSHFLNEGFVQKLFSFRLVMFLYTPIYIIHSFLVKKSISKNC